MALHIVQAQFNIDYSNWKGPKANCNKFIVHRLKNAALHFTMSATGLYYIHLKSILPATVLMFNKIKQANKLKYPPTIKEQKYEFSKRDQEAIKEVRDFQVTYNNISNKCLLKLINSN